MSPDKFEEHLYRAASKDGLMRFLWRLFGPRKDEIGLRFEIYYLQRELERAKSELDWEEKKFYRMMDSHNEACTEVEKRDWLIRDLRIRLSEASRNLTRLQKLNLP